MQKVVVTGASGFVGRTLLARLEGRAHAVSLRDPRWEHAVGDAPFDGACVFHLAARVHDPRATEDDYSRDNVEKTRALARLVAARGGRRIVFLSSIKVNGEETRNHAFCAPDRDAPKDAYARSKQRAEQVLREECAAGGVEAVVVRAPLVYGRGAAGNLGALARLADTPWPLPFGAIDNARSFIHVEDLCAALMAGADRAGAPGRTFLVAHREAPSTPQLVARLRARLGRPARLFDVPAETLEGLAGAIGQGERMRRLTRSLVVDPSLAEHELGWSARRSLDDAVADLVAGHRGSAAP